MNRGKILSLCLIAAVCLGTLGCGGDADPRYEPIKKLMADQTKIFKDTTEGLNKAVNAEEIAAVLNQWAEGMRELFPRFREHSELLSKLKEMDPPIELQAVNMELERALREMNEASAKIQSFQDDPQVQAGQRNLLKVMEELKEIDPSLK